MGVEGAVPDSNFVEDGIQFRRATIGVLASPVLTKVQRKAEVVGVDVTLGDHRSGERQSAIHVSIDITGASHGHGDQMPSSIWQVGGRLLAVLVGRARAGQLNTDHCTTLGEDTPAAVVGAVPVLVGDEGLVAGLADLLHPERHGEVLGVTELEGIRVTEGHVVVERTILEVLHVDALTALAGLEVRGTHSRGGDIALQVAVVAIERQVGHQAIAQN